MDSLDNAAEGWRPRYQALHQGNIALSPYWQRLPDHVREAIRVVSCVLPFKTNRYIMDELIDWARAPDDPIFHLTFPHPDMLDPGDYSLVKALVLAGADKVGRASCRERV